MQTFTCWLKQTKQPKQMEMTELTPAWKKKWNENEMEKNTLLLSHIQYNAI